MLTVAHPAGRMVNAWRKFVFVCEYIRMCVRAPQSPQVRRVSAHCVSVLFAAIRMLSVFCVDHVIKAFM